MTYPFVSLGEVVASSTGTANPGKAPLDTFRYVDVAAVDNGQKRIVGTRVVLGAEAPSRARKLISANDVLVSTVRPNLNAVALVPAILQGAIASTGFSVLRATQVAMPEFIFYFVQSQRFIESLCKLTAGALYPAVTDRQVLEQRLPLPPVPEQRRIVDVLSRAESIVRLRREAQKKAAELIPALLTDLFGDPATNHKSWPVRRLDEVSQVISGATKGRRLPPEQAIELPYMRVANVKDGHLDLTEIKTIQIKRSEIDRLKIEIGDLLMTEGGDPDKLGRAALWAGQVELCVHQNHIFKVRSDRTQVLPEYLRALVGSAYGKDHFLRIAKKTTGIASINKTQLSAFPVVLPPVEKQRAFVAHVATMESIQTQQATATTQAEATFNALLAQVFASV